MTKKDIWTSVIGTEATKKNVRLMLPVMIHWAKTGQNNHTYGDLTHAIGKSKFSGIGHALYCVQAVLDELAKRTGRYDIPTLNSLCKNSKTYLPSEGFEYISPKYKGMNEKEKSIFVDGLDSRAIKFEHWDWVLDKLDIKEYRPLTDEDLVAIKNLAVGFGGESEEHKRLKEFIKNNPCSIGCKDVTFSETEHLLPSGDRLDVYFELSDGTHVAVEVKPSLSPESDITRGIFQCVKYYSVMDALRTIECSDYEIDVILITASELSLRNRRLAEELDVVYTDRFEYEK